MHFFIIKGKCQIILDLLFNIPNLFSWNCQSNSQLRYLEVQLKTNVFYTYTRNNVPNLVWWSGQEMEVVAQPTQAFQNCNHSDWWIGGFNRPFVHLTCFGEPYQLCCMARSPDVSEVPSTHVPLILMLRYKIQN